ncbi:MAG: DUF4423 domain-containing protein [Bacteriovoracaceae bacterium]|nr:DUF4423 domain-containing protein [Bacteriovoracaceae bacterium]
MDIYLFNNYVSFVEKCLKGDGEKRPRGRVKGLADYIGCHSTFISQVLQKKANFNNEQGLKFCQFMGLSEDEVDFFFLLLARDRSGTADLNSYYQKKIDKIILGRQDLKKRWNIKGDDLNREHEMEYFSSWAYQAVHALIQIEKYNTPELVADILGLDEKFVFDILKRLQEFNLARKKNEKWQVCSNSLHLGKDSLMIRTLHTNWRLKTLSDMHSGIGKSGLHYSGVASMSKKAASEIREKYLNLISDIRDCVHDSTPQCLYYIGYDYYPLLK